MVLHSPFNTCFNYRRGDLTGHESTDTVHVVDRPGKGSKLGCDERHPGTKEDVGRRAIWAVEACKLIHPAIFSSYFLLYFSVTCWYLLSD